MCRVSCVVIGTRVVGRGHRRVAGRLRGHDGHLKRGPVNVDSVLKDEIAYSFLVYLTLTLASPTHGTVFSIIPLNTTEQIHRLVKGTGIMGGDVEGTNGARSHSALGTRSFPDEAFFIPHRCVNEIVAHDRTIF